MNTPLRYVDSAIRSVGMTVITAHSGCEGTAPNSRAHILAAIASGAEMVEVDIRERNGLLYLSHDEGEDPAACVSFGEFLELISPIPALRVNCDVKTDGLIESVMAAATAKGQGWRILFTGQCNHQGELIASLGADLWISMWPGKDNETAVRETADTCTAADPILNLHYSMISEENYAYLRERGMNFSAWTVDDEDALRTLLEMGITNITTRKPVLALRLRDEIQGTPASHGLLPLAQMESLIRSAGEIMRSVPDEVRNNPACKEGSANFVTAYDVKVQEFLKEGLSRLFPDAHFFAEEDGESSKAIGDGYTFIIDPIDGTTNFMCGYNTSAVSVGLLLDGSPIFGGIYDPYRDEYFSAVAGQGATCNGKSITVSTRPITRGIVAIGSAPYRKDTLSETMLSMTADLFHTFADFRRSGSAALDICHVASGRLDAFCEPILSPWDYAAGSVILSEAGGIATNFAGKPLDLSAPSSCVFGSPASHPTALGVCEKYASVTESII
jgi:myo-inositol-1(or 4)-monophosphatase